MNVGNKVVMKREENVRRSNHELRIRSSKSVVKSLSPIGSACRVSNAKKVQLMEERFTEIERENRILYEKMLKIKLKAPNFANSSSKRSLNETARKLRIKEINQENSNMLDRIQRKQSCYRLDKFNGERKEAEKYLSIISEFPLMGKIKRQMSSTSNVLSKSYKNATGGRDAGKLLIRQGKILNDRSFLVEVYKNSDNFRVAAYDLGHPDKHMLHLLPCEVKEVCGEELDLKKLIARIDLNNGVLTIMPSRPVSSLN